MKYTAAIAMLLATSSAVVLKDDWVNHGLPYDLNKEDLDKAQATFNEKATALAHAEKALTIAENAYFAADATAKAATDAHNLAQ